MKEAIVRVGTRIDVREVPIPEPGDNEIQIKVIVSGTNPKDWKNPERGMGERNEGDDIAGIVTKVGKNIVEFHPGDRVAALHRMRGPHGSFAEYAIAPAHTTFHIPNHTSFEEAATIPLAAMTAAVGLYVRMQLPQSFTPARDPCPLLIYGAASAVGAYAIKLASRSNLHPLICVAGRGASFVETLIDQSKGDTVIDYRNGGVTKLFSLPAGQILKYAFDCVCSETSISDCTELLSRGGSKFTMVLPPPNYKSPSWIEQSFSNVGSVQGDTTFGPGPDDHDFGFAWYRLFALGLQEGWLNGHPYEVVPGGLNGIQRALTNLKEGKASATKYVVRIAD